MFKNISVPIVSVVFFLGVALSFQLGYSRSLTYKPGLTKGDEIPTSITNREIDFLKRDAAEKDRPFFPDGPSPLPARLLVKIDEKEVLYKYGLTLLGNSDTRRRFPELLRLPGTLPLSHAEELGQSSEEKKLIRLNFEKPISLDEIESLMKNTSLSVRRDLIPKASEMNLSTVVVETSYNLADDLFRPISSLEFPQLKPKSPLQALFRQLGVHSIQRVFRMVEISDRKGTIKVVPMAELLQNPKKQFPLRSARRVLTAKIPPDMENWFLLSFSSKTDLRHALAVLRASQGIQEASFDYPVILDQDPRQEPDYQNQWALHSGANWGINIEPAWAVTTTTQRVVVAVIDSGIKEDLDEFTGRIWHNPSEISGDAIDNDSNGYIDDITGITVNHQAPASPPIVDGDHGTKVGAIIAANATNVIRMSGVAGIADVVLMNISSGGSFGCSGAAEGFEYATLNGADIINASWSTWPNPLLWEATQTALASGVTIVASAGNQNKRVSQNYEIEYARYPAFWDHVIAVGGTDMYGHRWKENDPNVGSNYGVGIDVVGPARDVTTISFSNDDQKAVPATLTGTSASAPLVSGVAALILAKYPNTRVEKMESWLRATATDLLDPEGTGANLTGEDLFTGSGLVNAGRALTQGEPDPVILEIKVEKSWYQIVDWIDNAVGAKPDLGIKVQGPFVGTWKLHIGEGDWPNSWTELSVPPQVARNAIDVKVQSPYEVDIDGGYRYLDTDGLRNRQVYTIRLTAQDAGGRTYTAYDWFMPIRAMITLPRDRSPIVTRWGMPIITGIVDVRPGATYRLSIIEPIIGPIDPLRRWEMSPASVPSSRLYQTHRGIQNSILAVPKDRDDPLSLYYPKSEALEGAFVSEGWKWLVLSVTTGAGVTTTDKQLIYIDRTQFATRPSWPLNIAHRPPVWGHPALARGIKSVDIDGNHNYRIFIQFDGHFVSLTPSGTILWDLPIYLEGDYGYEDEKFAPVFVIEDLNGDGTKEILVSGLMMDPLTSKKTIVVYLLRPDGQPFSPQWPKSFPYYDDPEQNLGMIPGKLHVGDVDGNGVKEIIFYEKGHFSNQIPEAERGIGRIHVLRLDGTEVPGWPVSLSQAFAPLQVGDIDADGKDEILVELNTGYVVYEDNGQVKPGWPVQTFSGFHRGARLVQLDSDPQLEILHYGLARIGTEYRYAVNVLKQDGSNAPGFPVYLDQGISRDPGRSTQTTNLYSLIYAKTTQINPGGYPEIVVAFDKIKVLNADGSTVTSLPEINLDGQSRGIDLIDVDGDGALEYVVVVEKWVNDEGWIQEGHFSLEAYKLNGTPLSATDRRWPIRLSYPNDYGYFGNQAWKATISIEDIDGNGTLEVINLLQVKEGFDCRIEVLDLRN